MSMLQEMVSTLFQRAIQTFKEYGATDEEVISGIREGEDVFRKLHLTEYDKVNEILTAVDKELDKLNVKKD